MSAPARAHAAAPAKKQGADLPVRDRARPEAAADGPVLFRCACGGGCPRCRSDDALHPKLAAGAADFAPPIVHDVLAAPGRPLDPGTRERMESRFGADFGAVRVHDGARAAESARAVDAHAYTVGRDIAFAAGRYAPGTAAGDRLLAHELAHTLQGGGAVLRRQVADPGSRAEPPEPPPYGLTIDLLDPANSSVRIEGFGLPSPRDLMNGLDRIRRFGEPPPTPANPFPPGWPNRPLAPEDICSLAPRLCPSFPGTLAPTLPQLPPFLLRMPQLQMPRLLFHDRRVLDHITYDETGVPDRHRGELDRTATEMLDHPPLVADVTGHTDTHGDPGYNQRLSERRARAVHDHLLDRQVPPLQLWSVTGAGETAPRFPNDATDWLAAARNRRVEVLLRRMEWRITVPGGGTPGLLPAPGPAPGAAPTLPVTDPRPRVLPADRARFDQLRTLLTTLRAEIGAVLAETPPREAWAVPDNENVTAMLRVLDALADALAAERHVVRFDLPTTGSTAARYQVLQDEIHLRPFAGATQLNETAASLLHEYTHHEQDVTAEQLLRAGRLPLEHTAEDELRQETEARRHEVYFTRLMVMAGHPVDFHTELSARVFLGRFERERTGSPAEQAAARREIRTELGAPYAGQLAANAPSRRYLVEIRPDRHAILAGAGGAETDLGAVPPAIGTQQRLETHLAAQVDALPTRPSLFRGPGNQPLVVIQFVVFDAGHKVAEFGLRP